MISEPEERAAATAITADASGGTQRMTDEAAGAAAAATADATRAGDNATRAGDDATRAGATQAESTGTAGASLEVFSGSNVEATEIAAMPASANPVVAAEARDTVPPLSPAEAARASRNSLETIKTAVVWLVVIQILTILSPLLRVSLKWTLVVGLILALSSFALGIVAYVKAQRAQRAFPE